MKMTIGIFGGSFNPIHWGHIRLARQIVGVAELDEVWLMVSPQNPLKRDVNLLDEQLRLQMARKALENEPRIEASDFEFHLPRPSYTWNTLQALNEAYPSIRFSLIIGADNWQLFPRWYRADDIISRYPVIVYPRKGSPIDESALPSSVRLVKTRLYNVSSTEIRRRVREGQSLNRLVPRAIQPLVEQYYR
ncbi:MAG: nicotinate-nucleotide adenylyltransferase [Prevotella sp.]|nr:nicotinate-nucleotide adenylyltransferase [Prevotella sp.]